MFNEIGSNFCEALPITGDLLRDTPSTVFLDSGRSAIRLALGSIRSSNRRALLPAYTCEVVISPFLEMGYDVAYYQVDRELWVDADKFQALIEQFQPSVVFVHSYFGFDTASNLRRILSQAHDAGTVVIEDLTHSLFGDHRHTCADFYVGSLRKWIGIPDGGFLSVCHDKFRIDPPMHENTAYVSIRSKAQELKREYIRTMDDGTKQRYRALFSASEELLDGQNQAYTMSTVARSAIIGTDYQLLKKRRKENYALLHNGLTDLSEIHIPQSLSGNVNAPLYFVILTDKRECLQRYMAQRHIYLPVIWPMPPQVKGKLSPDTQYIYENVLAIPCDQRYEKGDMDRVVAGIHQFFLEEPQ